MNKLFAFTLLASLFLFSACKKEDPDTVPPVVTIEEPLATETFVNGDTMHLHADVEDDTELHEVIFTITDISNNSVEATETFHTHEMDFHGELEYVVNVPAGSVLELKVEAEDDAANFTTESLEFTIAQ